MRNFGSTEIGFQIIKPLKNVKNLAKGRSDGT